MVDASSAGAVTEGNADKDGAVAHQGDLNCWGARLAHSNMPHYIRGPFKQVSVGSLGVCALRSAEGEGANNSTNTDTTMPHSMQCWGFVTNLVSQEATNTAWDQVAVGTLSVCAVTMLSELECWGT